MDNVNRTLYIPLFCKAHVSKRGVILNDKIAEKIWDNNPVPLGKKSKSKWLAYFMAMRSRVFDDWVRQMLSEHEDAIVVHIGCGLDSRAVRIGAENTIWYDLDFPSVIKERKKYYSENHHYRMISGNAMQNEWLSRIPAGKEAVVVMEGVSMYIPPKKLEGLFSMLQTHFSALNILMDVYTEFGAKMSEVRNPINEVGVTKTFGMNNPSVPLSTSSIAYVREHSMTPPELVNQLKGFERFFFKSMFAGKFANKMYRMYEYKY